MNLKQINIQEYDQTFCPNWTLLSKVSIFIGWLWKGSTGTEGLVPSGIS